MYSAITALTTLLPLLAVAAPAAKRQTEYPNCNGGDIVWTIHNLTFHSSDTFSTPAHQIPGGWVDFNLTNTQVDYVTQCSAYSTQLSDYFYGNQVFQCKDNVFGNETTFTYSYLSGAVGVNSTWTCMTAPNTVARFSGQGSGNTGTLDCNTTNYQNPDWQQGEIYSSTTTTCSPVDLDIKPTSITAVA